MSRKWLLSLIVLVVSAVVFVPVSDARFDLKVIETATTISFQQLAPTVVLSVDNGYTKPLSAVVRVELLNPSNQSIASAETALTLKSGQQKVPLVLPLETRELTSKHDRNLLWYRLHYTVTAKTPDASTNVSPLEGFISLSEITPELFELRVAGPGGVREGTVYQALVHAVHPITDGPAKGVHIKASATFTDEATEKAVVLTCAAITDGEGYATLKFQLPHTSAANDFELRIEGTRGFVTTLVEKEIDINLHGEMAVSTDKPIYQPGQTLHARALLLGASKRALAGRNVTLKIKDPEGGVAFSVELKTSRFGIASADWPIPEHTRLGTYSLEFSTGEDESSYSTVKISRYDLPNFVVNVKTDRPYYLPGQDATITVRGDYLFGEPVMRGQVRVVRDVEQTWNYKEQKYETTEGEVFKGELDSNQTFKVRIPLSDDFEELKDEDYSRFEDLHLTAFVTDASTNRTEQRRFDLRISKEGIHVYATRPSDSYRESARLPLTIYVSTFYPDGTPAPCNVLITQGGPDDYDEDEKPPIIGRVKTNQYGVGKLSSSLTPTVEDSSYLKLNFTAQDRNRNKGTRLEEFYLYEDDQGIRINTTKTVYAPGEQILANIITTEPSMAVVLDVVRDWSVIQSQLIHVRDRRASILLPYKPEFKGLITLVAHAENDDDSRVSDSRTIIYPYPRDLKLRLQSTAETYRPGDQASVSFKALNAAGSSVESALGIVVFDRAVEERARTDAEHGRYETFVDAALSLGGSGDSVGNVSVKTLEKLDLSKPVPADLDLAAEILLNRYSSYFFDSFSSEDYTKDFRSVFVMRIADQLEPLRTVLANTYQKTMTYPTDESSLRRFLSNNGLDFDAFKDPWGMPYRLSFPKELQSDVLVLESAGADKRFDTEDDISSTRITWPYFRPTGEAINKAVATFHQRTGGFIRDFKTLRDELLPLGINLDTLKDRWLKPYTFTFDVVGTNLLINVGTTNSTGYVFSLWQSRIDYFAELRARIDSTLNERTRTSRFPESRAQMRDALLPAGIDIDSLRDPWGNPYYVTFSTVSLYGDRARMEARTVRDGAGTKQTLEVKPVTSVLLSAKFRSSGHDGKEGTADDFDVATFSVTHSQQSVSDSQPKPVPIMFTFSGATGVITGTVTDAVGAAIPGAKVSATTPGITEVFSATTNDDGRYVLRNLPSGTYQVSVEATSFKNAVITNVVVQTATVFELNVTLEVGTVSETVSVSAGAEATITTRSLMALPLNGRSQSNLLLDGVSRNGAVKPARSVIEKPQQPFSTPRLREYFPETLVWQPELVTDKKGKAQLDFKLADNITTWKMAVIGSTETGEIGIAETEIKTFQPFFAELDPPQILTQGDQISLPVVLRNYLPKTQTVDLELKPENWFSVAATRKKTNVAARDSATQFFDIQATSSIAKGQQHVTALGSDFSDAIEKSVTVHPDGEEKSITVTDLLQQSTKLQFDLPSETITNSAHVQLKVFPNLASHVGESVEAILQRPYGCGEQTISSTYPSVLVLHYLKQTKQGSPLGATAQRYLWMGYQRLLGYQGSDGGFTYWGRGDGDVALTAYAIRFLTDASEFTEVDTEVISRARAWLVKQQRPDGSWPAMSSNKVENERQTGMLTALVARSLSQGLSCNSTSNSTSPEKLALTKLLDYLDRRSNEMDEPYLIASYSLAASSACEPQRAAKANNRLRDLAKHSTRGAYWSLETNTPFYGWGMAGRVETTALAVQALAQERASNPQATTNDDLIGSGLLFLLREKDRYGVWYSGQATINVLNTLLTIISTPANVNDNVDVFVNNQKINSVPVPANQQMVSPLIVDLTSSIRPGKNVVELKRSGAGATASVQIVGTYWIPWTTPATTDANADSRSLRLNTRCDKTNARIMEQITCRVKAERVGSRGYGMLLAEIGLPPGADVDRASLDAAIKTNWAIDQYDILPDRVIVYLWPRGGGSEFEFKFKPRMAINAQSAASVLYDYYNPEARVTVAPTRFVVK
jgi:hypothetical protein